MEQLDQLCINTLRTLSIDAIQKANSGHPGLPLGAAPMAWVLWDRFLKVSGEHPDWPDRDRFVLSAGHGSMLLYSLLHLGGFPVSMEDIKRFRQLGSNTPGHPESFLTAGVEATTGPLGQGCTNSVGMAIAERALAHYFNRPGYTLVDHYTYSILGDGDVMEGISSEASSLAGHLKLGKLIHLYDANRVCLDGPTDMTFTENVAQRYQAYGWHVQTVEDGDHDLAAIEKALEQARAETTKPSLIIVHTTIGFGSPNKAGTSNVHGSPLGPEELAKTKEALGWPSQDPFYIPPEAQARFAQRAQQTAQQYQAWCETFAAYEKAYPELAAQWRLAMKGELPADWDAHIPTFAAGESIATRSAGGKIMNAIAKAVPTFIGGDADLSVSTKTALSDTGSFEGQGGSGRNIHYGVREHAMGAIANGIAYHGGLHTFTATFFCFSDYMKPALRLAALNSLPTVHVFTHDSIGLGEDGPTHQAVEHLAALRALPNYHVVRPADANETAEAWRYALQRKSGPTALVLSRQNLPVFDRTTLGPASDLHKGAYVLRRARKKAELILIATGSEVALALEAAQALEDQGIHARVVSMPCWEAFLAQPVEYQHAVLPPAIEARLAIEAGVSMGWSTFVGPKGAVIAVDKFGASAPAEDVFAAFGFTVDNVVNTAKGLLG